MVINKLPYLIIFASVCQLHVYAQAIKVPLRADTLKGSITSGTDYWVLDDNKHKVQSYLRLEVNKTLKVFEHWFGPYPFYKDSFKIVETPYPGMEICDRFYHKTILNTYSSFE